ncbi:MAG TPA: hypothetical protein VKK79_06570, partial [Candidatus Lokiarchaeia archaeon]|nr:hypothetical protein [Candidatus Lokiarchaeia archaeon]
LQVPNNATNVLWHNISDSTSHLLPLTGISVGHEPVFLTYTAGAAGDSAVLTIQDPLALVGFVAGLPIAIAGIIALALYLEMSKKRKP